MHLLVLDVGNNIWNQIKQLIFDFHKHITGFIYEISMFMLHDYLLANKFVSTIAAFIALTAATGNFVLFLTIIRSKQIHSICSALIAIQAFAEVIYPLSILSFLFVSYAEILTLRRYCLWWQQIPLAAANVSIAMMPLVALDRFIALVVPIWYQRLNRLVYISALMTFPIVFNLICAYLGYAYTNDDLVVCRLPDGYRSTAIYFWVGAQIVIAFVVLILYFLIKFTLKARKGKIKDVTSATNKSLQIIFFVYVCGYALFAVINFGSFFVHDYYLFLTIGSISSSTALLNVAVPVIVLYNNSKLYRREIQATLRLCLGIKSVTHVQVAWMSTATAP